MDQMNPERLTSVTIDDLVRWGLRREHAHTLADSGALYPITFEVARLLPALEIRADIVRWAAGMTRSVGFFGGYGDDLGDSGGFGFGDCNAYGDGGITTGCAGDGQGSYGICAGGSFGSGSGDYGYPNADGGHGFGCYGDGTGSDGFGSGDSYSEGGWGYGGYGGHGFGDGSDGYEPSGSGGDGADGGGHG